MTVKLNTIGRPARDISRHKTPTGREFVIYETPTYVDAVSVEEWESWSNSDPAAFARASVVAIEQKQRADDVRAHGIDVGLGDYRLVRMTPKQAVLEVPGNGTVSRYSRSTWRRIGSSRWDGALNHSVVAKIEEHAAGRRTVDFIAEGKAATATLPGTGKGEES